TEEPVCFKAVWGDKKGRYEQGEIKDGVWAEDSNGTKYYKEVPENPCTSNEDGIKLEPKGGEYTVWDVTNCRCNLNKCPTGTFDSESECQKGEFCFTCEARTKEDDTKYGDLTCYERVEMPNYDTPENWEINGICYDEKSPKTSANGVVCYLPGDCKCPEGTTANKTDFDYMRCYDKYADSELKKKEVTLADGTVCYPTDKPECDESIGEYYDTTNCECISSGCFEGQPYDEVPYKVCAKCTYTGQTVTIGGVKKGCWMCDDEEVGFSTTKPEGNCIIENKFDKIAEDGPVAQTTCYKPGEEEVTDAECVIKDIVISQSAASVTFTKYIRATTLCEVEGSIPETNDIKLGDGSIAVSGLDPCKDGKISFTSQGEYKSKSYICNVDADVAPDCPNLCSGEDGFSADFPETISSDGGTYTVTFRSVYNGEWGGAGSFRYETADYKCPWMEHWFTEPYNKDNCTRNATITLDEFCDETGDDERSVTVTYVQGNNSGKYIRHTYTQKNKCKSPSKVCEGLNADGYADSFKPKSDLNITKTAGWACQTVGSTECCAPKKCPNSDTVAASPDLTSHVDANSNCISYQSTNPKTYSGEDECLKEVSENICPNGGEAYASESEAKRALGNDATAIGSSHDCGGKSYTCYTGDPEPLCQSYSSDYHATCDAGCIDGKTLRSCVDVSAKTGGIKCYKVEDEECADNQKCDGSQDKCVDDLPKECDTTFDGWTFEGSYVINNDACTDKCENCVETGQTLQNGKKCYAHTANPDTELKKGNYAEHDCAQNYTFISGNVTVACYKDGQIDETPHCFIEDVDPEVSKITASTKEIKYKRNVRVARQCHEGGKYLGLSEVLQSESNTLTFPGFNDTTCENGKLVRLAANDSTTYNGKLLECKLATNIQINCPVTCTPTRDCSEYTLQSKGASVEGTYDTCDDGCGKITYRCIDGYEYSSRTARCESTCPAEYEYLASGTGSSSGDKKLDLSFGNYEECTAGNVTKYKCKAGFSAISKGSNIYICSSGDGGTSGGKCAYVRCVENPLSNDMACEWYVPSPNFTQVTVHADNGQTNTVKASDMRSGASGTYAVTGAPGHISSARCQFYPYGDLVSFKTLAGPCKIGTEYRAGACGECVTAHCDGDNNTQPETKSVTEKCPEGSCTKADGATGTGIIAGYANGEPCYQEQVCNDDGSSKEHEECICECPNGYWYSIENPSRDGIFPGSTGYNPQGDYGDYSGDCEEFGYNGQWCSCPTREYKNTDPKMERTP
ncbi:MAG: hypothetical protein IKN71_08370, partial [Alphaproteobacteria bacterium]|nr:hypothetical protein [Alphaproteobacteria bacterium]